jgi:hypothetical protein
MKNATLILLIAATFSLGFSALADDGDDLPENRMAFDIKERCESTKEFITTFEYLKSHAELGLNENENFKVAQSVAKGCTGAAQRFVKTFELLMKAEAGPRGSMNVAIDLANKSQNYADTFNLIFTRSYLAEFLDLDYKTSFELAQRLSVDYDGNPKIAAKDFLKLVDFCTNEKEVGLSKPRCGVIAARVVQKTEGFHAQMAAEFFKIYHFLISDKGPSSPVVKALEVAESVIEQGPEAGDNFIAAYKYAVDRKGLDFTAERSISFAQSLAHNTWYNAHDKTLPAPMVDVPMPAEAPASVDPAAKTTTELRAPAGTDAPPTEATSPKQ